MGVASVVNISYNDNYGGSTSTVWLTLFSTLILMDPDLDGSNAAQWTNCCCFLRFDISVQYSGQDPTNSPSPLSTVFDTSN